MTQTPQNTSAAHQPRRLVRRGLRALLGATILAAVTATPAMAEYANTTVQATRAHADWLPYAAAPAGGAGAVCLVDTGVDLNPDTTAAVIAQLPLYGTTTGDTGSTHHGTLMTEIMAAPHNGYGMVGAWPALKVVDVRALTPGFDTFTYSDYQRAITKCRSFPGPLKVINLSLAGDPSLVTQEERDQFANRVGQAQVNGNINVVAAAGNAGGPVLTPGDNGGVFTVAAGDASGLCAFTSRGLQVSITAPGCRLDQAFTDGSPAVDGWGSSQASAFTSAVLTAMRSYAPALSYSAAETALTSTADHQSDGYSSLNVEAAFRSVGLGSVVDSAKTAMAASGVPVHDPVAGSSSGGGGSSSSSGGTGGSGGPAKRADPTAVVPPTDATAAPAGPLEFPTAVSSVADPQLVKPKAAKLTTGPLGTRMTLTNRPAGALAIVSIYAVRAGKTRSSKEFPVVVKRLRGETSRFVVGVKAWTRIEVRYRDGLSTDSTVLTIKPTAVLKTKVAKSGAKAHR
jgi:hypothetical protein